MSIVELMKQCNCGGEVKNTTIRRKYFYYPKTKQERMQIIEGNYPDGFHLFLTVCKLRGSNMKEKIMEHTIIWHKHHPYMEFSTEEQL